MQGTMRSLALLGTATLANGHLFYTFAYDLEPQPVYSYARSWGDAPSGTMTRSEWRMSPDHYSVKIQTPAVEEGSISASLSSDGTTLSVNAKRYIEGCSCQESTVGQVQLPHTPRAEDIDLTHDPNTGLVSVKVARHAKTLEPTPVIIKTLEPKVEAEAHRSGITQNDGMIRHPETQSESASDKLKIVEQVFGALKKYRSATAAEADQPESPAAAEKPEEKKSSDLPSSAEEPKDESATQPTAS